MPDRVIKVINDWGKSQKNVNFKKRLEFWDRLKKHYGWENEDLDLSNGKVEVEPVSNYPHILVKFQECVWNLTYSQKMALCRNN